MNLKELIGYLEKKDRDIVVPMGFNEPHLYRGDYMCLAFEPERDVTIGAMLDYARKALGSTYQGWNGVDYRMNRNTEVYLAIEGHTGEKIGTVLLDYMTGVYEGEECESLRGVISRSTDQIAGLIADRDHVRTDLKSADSKLFEYRVQIVEQSKAIHDLTVEKAQVGRAIGAMCSTISEQNKEINELGHRNENQMGSIQYQRKILKELTEEKAQVDQDIEVMAGTISEQNQILLHINAELEAIKQHNPFDLVFITYSIENISNVIKGHKKPFIDEERIECARVVDVAAKLQKELDVSRRLVSSYKKGIENRDKTNSELNAWVSRLATTIESLETTIEELKDKNIEDLHELYDIDKTEFEDMKTGCEIMFRNYLNTIAKLQDDSKGLEDRIVFDAEHIDRLNKVITSQINEIRDLEAEKQVSEKRPKESE